MIGIVTDSNSQFPPALAERYGVEVVPLEVIVDGTSYREGVDLTVDEFYARFRGGSVPEVATSQPSPGAFVDAYRRVLARGATEVLSVHIGADVSGTLNSARLASAEIDAPVRLVDTGTASFGIACCAWAAADAIAGGATLERAAAVAEGLAPTIGNVFVVGGLELARAGGRVRLDDDVDATETVPVLSLVDGAIEVVGSAAGADEAAAAMARYACAFGTGLRAAVGLADAATAPLADALERALKACPTVTEVVRYRVGPSVGVHTGPGTAGAFFYPPPQ